MADEEEKFDYSELAPWTRKYEYVPVFGVPDEPWKIGALWEEAYFDSAKYVIEGVLKRELVARVHGVAGVFLFRHYLEIALKFIIFHARWLVDANQNAKNEDIEDVGKTHNLKWLWETAEKECNGKIPDDTWKEFDVEFAKKMILEFHTIDSSGFRFRYHGDRFGVEKDPSKAQVMNELYIDYDVLLAQMEHTRGVLSAIDSYLYESHGQNAEWEAEMNSW